MTQSINIFKICRSAAKISVNRKQGKYGIVTAKYGIVTAKYGIVTAKYGIVTAKYGIVTANHCAYIALLSDVTECMRPSNIFCNG